MLSVFIALGFLSLWLIWNSFLCFYVLKLDKSFPIIFHSRKRLLKYLAYVFTLLGFSMYIFLIRYNNMGRTVNANVLWEEISNLVKSLSWLEGVVFVTFGLLLMIFWVMLVRVILHYFRQSILALFLYYFQYYYFREICYWWIQLSCDYTCYLMRRVSIFTKNTYIRSKARLLWPIGIEKILSRLYVVILPYLTIFDIVVHHGQISKIFIILPWFYVYSLFRGFCYLFDKLFVEENQEFTEETYGIR